MYPNGCQSLFSVLKSLNDLDNSVDSDDSKGRTPSSDHLLDTLCQGMALHTPFDRMVQNTRSQRRKSNSSTKGFVQRKRTTNKKETKPKPSRPTEYVQIGNTTLTLRSGNLAEQEAEVTVNSIAKDLDLMKGAGSASLLRVGGQEIQDECWAQYQEISNGDVVITTGGKLQCSQIYHINIPPWGNCNEEEIKLALSNCLAIAEAQEVKSIAIPPLGGGLLNYPSGVIAKMMVSAIVDRDEPQNCKSVYIICHRSENLLYQELKKEIQQLTVQVCLDISKGDLKTPSYWTKYDHSKSLPSWNCHLLSNKCWEKVAVTKEEFIEIGDIVQKTWMSQFVGRGRDAKGLKELHYQDIKVIQIDRIENPLLAQTYIQTRATMFNKTGKLERAFPQLEHIPYTQSGPILTSSNKGPVLSRDLFPMVNEHYLFHGTTSERIDIIAAQGFDIRLTQNAMFGAGVYAAESSTKADQYSDQKDQRDKDKPKTMILARFLLGEMFVVNDEQSFHRPPCKTCKQDTCCEPSHNHHGIGFYDSVVVDGQWNFREFVVYNSSQCYPEYIIKYKRV